MKKHYLLLILALIAGLVVLTTNMIPEEYISGKVIIFNNFVFGMGCWILTIVGVFNLTHQEDPDKIPD